MPTLGQVKTYRDAMHRRSMALIERKGADYNRDQQHGGDTLFNLRVAALLGVVPTPEVGILVRLSDKFMRLISLCKESTREPSVTDESVADTIADIHNYIDYLACFRMEQRGETLPEVPEGHE